MDNGRDSGGTRSEKFFTGKGFYIVLFLCLAVIGVSVWTLVSGTGTMEEPATDIELAEPTATAGGTNESLEAGSEYESAMWEIPDGTEEVLAEPEEPETASEAATEPEPVNEMSRAFIWPVVGEIESPYSVTTLMYDPTMSDWRTHSGIDIAAVLGDKVMAAASGTVAEIYNDELYGTTVVIDHGEGLSSVYSNLAELPTVKVGDAVLGGETIGSIGTTALCEIGEPTHLHFAMTLDGERVDPNDYLPSL
jgi:murein DD-endopeptidase MepM/ murein hydrolase activator NlpD